MTPAQRYLAAAKTISDLAGVDIVELFDGTEPIRGGVGLEGLERLAGICEIASRARGADLEQPKPFNVEILSISRKHAAPAVVTIELSAMTHLCSCGHPRSQHGCAPNHCHAGWVADANGERAEYCRCVTFTEPAAVQTSAPSDEPDPPKRAA